MGERTGSDKLMDHIFIGYVSSCCIYVVCSHTETNVTVTNLTLIPTYKVDNNMKFWQHNLQVF